MHLLICGDFNYSDINWSNPLDLIPNIAHSSQLYLLSLSRTFSFTNKWMNRLSRYSLSATPHTLDLVLTNEENMHMHICIICLVLGIVLHFNLIERVAWPRKVEFMHLSILCPTTPPGNGGE